MAQSDRGDGLVPPSASQQVSDLGTLLRALRPEPQPSPVVFCTVRRAATAHEVAGAIAIVREAEGTTLVMHEHDAAASGLTCSAAMSQITLAVNSSLDAVGLTAAVAAALADLGIACNVIAGFHHDHLFVPLDRADDAVGALRALSRQARLLSP